MPLVSDAALKQYARESNEPLMAVRLEVGGEGMKREETRVLSATGAAMGWGLQTSIGQILFSIASARGQAVLELAAIANRDSPGDTYFSRQMRGVFGDTRFRCPAEQEVSWGTDPGPHED
jgi:hypothetical protein